MNRSIGVVVLAAVLSPLLACKTADHQPLVDGADGVEDATGDIEDAATDSTPGELPAGTRDPALQPFSPQSIWNMPVATTATFEAAGGPITTGFARTDVGSYWINQAAYSHQVFAASAADPAAVVDDRYGRRGAYNINPASQPAAGMDGHLHTLSPERWKLDEAIGFARIDDFHYSASRHVAVDLLGDGVGPLNGVRAYGGSAIGGLIRMHEVNPASPSYTGEIDHALAVALDSRQMLYTGGPVGYTLAGYGTAKGYVPPATEQDGNSPALYAGNVPMGAYLAIPADVDLASLGLSPEGLMLARAAQDYGVYVTDTVTSTGCTFYVERDAPPAFRAALLANAAADLKKIVRALRVCTSNGAGNINGGPPEAARRKPLALPLPPRAFFRPALPASFTPAITIVGAPTSISTSFAPKLTLPMPAGLQAGHDLFIIGTSDQGTVMSLADPTFTPVGPAALYGDNGRVRLYLWRKHLSDPPPATLQVDLSASGRNASAMAVGFAGADAVSPVEPLPMYYSNTANGSSRSLALGPFSFTRPGSLLVLGLGLQSAGATIDSDGAVEFHDQGRRLILGLEQIPDLTSRGRTLMSGAANLTGVAFGFVLRP